MMANTILLPLAGGMLIGLAAVLLLAFNGRVMGASGIVGGLLPPAGDAAWRAAFLAGSVVAPVLLVLVGVPVEIRVEAGPVMLVVAGLLVGFGSGLGSGCTSGHGVCGIARLSPRSLAATACFMAVGFLTVWLVRHGIGG